MPATAPALGPGETRPIKLRDALRGAGADPLDHREQRLCDRGHQLRAAGQLPRDRDRVPERGIRPGLPALDAAGAAGPRRFRYRVPGHPAWPYRAACVLWSRPNAGAAAAPELQPGLPAYRRGHGWPWPGCRPALHPLPAAKRIPAGHSWQYRRDSALLVVVFPRSAASDLGSDRRVRPDPHARAGGPDLAGRGHCRGGPAPGVAVGEPESDVVSL